MASFISEPVGLDAPPFADLAPTNTKMSNATI